MYSLKSHSSIIMNITVPLKPETVVHTCNLSTQETEAGRSEGGGYLWIYSQSGASLGYTKPVSFPKIQSPCILCLR